MADFVIPKYKISAEKLRQQFISGQITNTSVEQYPDWVRKRADDLARAGNQFLEELRGNLRLPGPVTETGKQDHAFAAD